MRATGALNVAVLDGGFPMWQRKGFEIERGQMTGAYRKPKTNYEGRLEGNSFATLDDVRMAIQDDETVVVDARGKARFDGNLLFGLFKRGGGVLFMRGKLFPRIKSAPPPLLN